MADPVTGRLRSDNSFMGGRWIFIPVTLGCCPDWPDGFFVPADGRDYCIDVIPSRWSNKGANVGGAGGRIFWMFQSQRAADLHAERRPQDINVRFAPKNGHPSDGSARPLCAINRPEPAPIGYSASKPLLSFTNRSTPAWQIICLRTLCQLICFFYRRFILMFDSSFTNRLA